MNYLILLRHGQSQWNLENKFTGQTDVPLTKQGEKEAINAGEIINKLNIKIDIIFCSVLTRAIKTAQLTINQLNNHSHLYKDDNIIMTKDSALNERDYGQLVGLNKSDVAKKYGKEQTQLWRRSYNVAPPNGESLKNVIERVDPYFSQNIKSEINNKKNVLVVAHGNSLRAIMIKIGLYKPEEISKIELPTGSPFVVNFSSGNLKDANYLN